MTESILELSDHALVRYLERKIGLDFTSYREEINTIDLNLQVAVCGDGRYPIGGNMIAVIKNNTIVTILGEGDAS